MITYSGRTVPFCEVDLCKNQIIENYELAKSPNVPLNDDLSTLLIIENDEFQNTNETGADLR